MKDLKQSTYLAKKQKKEMALKGTPDRNCVKLVTGINKPPDGEEVVKRRPAVPELNTRPEASA